MTAVAVHQHGSHRQQYNPRQSPHSSNGPSPGSSRPQSYTASTQRQESPMPAVLNGNGPVSVINPRRTVSNDPVEVATGEGASDSEQISTPSAHQRTSAPLRNRRRGSLQARPASAPKPESSPDESEVDKTRPWPKPFLHRSKSDFGPRGDERDSKEEELQDWGARHGFESHYASEEYVSQLANVSCSFFSGFDFCFDL